MTGCSPAPRSMPFCAIAERQRQAELNLRAAGSDTGKAEVRTQEAARPAKEEATMIGQRQIDFRQEYRSRIIGWYDGYFHIAIIYAMGAAAFYVYVAHIH